MALALEVILVFVYLFIGLVDFYMAVWSKKDGSDRLYYLWYVFAGLLFIALCVHRIVAIGSKWG